MQQRHWFDETCIRQRRGRLLKIVQFAIQHYRLYNGRGNDLFPMASANSGISWQRARSARAHTANALRLRYTQPTHNRTAHGSYAGFDHHTLPVFAHNPQKEKEKMEKLNLSRRNFLKTVGVLSAGSLLAACVPAGDPTQQAGDDAPADAMQHLIVWLGGWTPTESMERSEDNPNPHNKILELLDDYQAEHPGVEIEWIRLPSGVNSREWQVAQQTAGTVPHVMPAAQWIIKEDVDKDWWVILTDALNEPNPYIAAGEPGSERWIDQFYPTPNTMLDIEGNFYNVAYGINTTWFFYNVDMFAELGISAPASFAEFLENCQVAQDAGPDRLRLPHPLPRRHRCLVSPADRLDDYGTRPGPAGQPGRQVRHPFRGRLRHPRRCLSRRPPPVPPVAGALEADHPLSPRRLGRAGARSQPPLPHQEDANRGERLLGDPTVRGPIPSWTSSGLPSGRRR